MPELTLAVWNMEWLNDLFVSDNVAAAFRPDDDRPQHARGTTVGARRRDLVGVLNEIAPDLVVITEGPSRSEELQLLFDTPELEGRWVAAIQDSPRSQQNVGIAVRTDTGKFDDPCFSHLSPPAPDAFAEFDADTDDDEILERYHFERTPLYVEVRPAGGRAFRILGLHLKSKGVFEVYEWSKWWLMADANRRKILAQARQVRKQFIDPYLTDDATRGVPLIVCGDINDGPGFDASERRLLGSGVEQLMGSVWHPRRCLRNALFDSMTTREREDLNFTRMATTSFRDPIFNNVYHHSWIDHVLYTDNVGDQPWVTAATVHRDLPDGTRIWNTYPDASDHQPVTVRVQV